MQTKEMGSKTCWVSEGLKQWQVPGWGGLASKKAKSERLDYASAQMDGCSSSSECIYCT